MDLSNPPIADVRARVAALRQRSTMAAPPDVRAAQTVVLLGSSSRGGSSIFAEVLRRSPRLLHFRAEINPYLRLHGVDGGVSDAIPADTPIPRGLGFDLGWDCGHPTDVLVGDDAIWNFALEIAVRLTLQWPTAELDAEIVHNAVRAVLLELQREAGWPVGRFVDAHAFHARLLTCLRRHWPEIHPGAYDLDRRLLDPDLPAFSPVTLVEEPPFVLVNPWRGVTDEELATQPLVIKTPSNAYRLPWLARLFPKANLRMLHLTRNVAASVNGLYDGWRYPGFHSHYVDVPLQIEGYTGVVPGGAHWWKFDRPPGWEAYTQRPLAEVAAFQWRSAHAAILAHAAPDTLRLRFEDVLGSRDRQLAAMLALSQWLRTPVAEELAAVLAGNLPAVMATEQPRHRRWFQRIPLLAPLLSDPETLTLMERLGYGTDPNAWE